MPSLVETLENRCLLHSCQISLSSAAYSVGEGDGTATITLQRNFASGDVSVDFNAAIGTAGSTDFTPIASQQISWLHTDPNQKTVNVTIAQDDDPEGNETIQLSLDNFQFTSPGAFSSATLTIIDDDDAGGSPVIANFGAGFTYRENAPPRPVTTTATVTDPDSANFATGKLTVKFLAGGRAEDRLAIRTAGNISTAGNQVRFAGQVMGTFTGGVGTTPLAVTFNAQATTIRVQALLRNITYSNVSQNPSTTSRTVSAQVTDGDGGTSAAVSKTISVTRVNDAPVLGGISGSVGYVRNSAAIVLAPAATVTDFDSPNFATGQLRVHITGTIHASNRLLIGGSFTVDASNRVFLGTTRIGTRTSSGVGTNDLVVTFNASATKAIVQQLARAITFRTTGVSPVGQRVIEFSVSDGDGGASNKVTKTVNVS